MIKSALLVAALCALTLFATTPVVSALNLAEDNVHVQAAVVRGDFEGINFFNTNKNNTYGTPMKLQLLKNTESTGAVCLDGTPGGFYFSPATTAKDANNWEIYFQGGGTIYMHPMYIK